MGVSCSLMRACALCTESSFASSCARNCERSEIACCSAFRFVSRRFETVSTST